MTHSPLFGEPSVVLAPDRCTPYRPGAARPRKLLGIWAHPDDEAYLSTTLMARTIQGGGEVTLVALSDGEAGFAADDTRPAPERARLRRAELRAAMATIGVTDVRFAGLPDGGLERHRDSIEAITAELMRAIRPDVTVTFGPDGMTGHADHVANSWGVTRAWRTTGVGELWYAAKSPAWFDRWRTMHDEFGVWMDGEPRGIQTLDAVFAAEATGRELDVKRQVLAEHASQTAPLSAALGEGVYREWISEESFRRPTSSELAIATSSRRLAGSRA